jgi:hypothetical protein
LTLLALPLATAQEPQPLPPAIEARPISDAEASTSNTLRWKTKPRGSPSEFVASEASIRPIHENTPQQPVRAGWNITRIDPSVRPVQHTSDPFSDPFGDKRSASGVRNTAATDGPALILQPTQAEAHVEELPPPRTLSPVRPPELSAPMYNVAERPGFSTAERPGYSTAERPGFSPAERHGISPAERPFASPAERPGFSVAQRPSPPSAAPPDMPMADDPPCDRMYQDRNCCKLVGDCIAFRNSLLSDSIRNISLDITPPFKHDPNITEDEARVDKLQRQVVRPWRNRRGVVIGTGQMSDIEHGAVILVDENGRETGRIRIDELAEDELCYLSAMWDLPSECPLGGIRTASRDWLCSTLHYHASAACHKPLYFEEVQLERYGHTAGPFRQPLISAAHFVISGLALPYQMGMHPPMECQYALGYYRPGNCAPWMIPPIPLSLEGAKFEVAAALGMIYLIP